MLSASKEISNQISDRIWVDKTWLYNVHESLDVAKSLFGNRPLGKINSLLVDTGSGFLPLDSSLCSSFGSPPPVGCHNLGSPDQKSMFFYKYSYDISDTSQLATCKYLCKLNTLNHG